MDLPRLSVIIPTFNRAELLCRAVKSVFDQESPFGVEVVIADDGSTDGTQDVLRARFPQEWSRSQLVYQWYENCGDCGAGRNRGARLARGKFLAFLDSDDYWLPGRILELSKFFESKDLILESWTNELPVSQDLISLFIGMNWGVVSSSVMSRKLFDKLGGFPEGYYRGSQSKIIQGWEDYETWLKALGYLSSIDQVDRFHLMPKKFVVYDPQPAGLGSMRIRRQMFRELATVLRTSSRFPLKYWPRVGRRILGASKAIVFGV